MYTVSMKQNTKLCQQCKQIFKKTFTDSYDYFINRRKYCSSSCMATAQKGKSVSPATQFKKGQGWGDKNPSWTGGRHKTTQGYITVLVGVKKYQLEHRYVMEKHLGRKLLSSEHVHHLNGDKIDNRLENLSLLDRKVHGRAHAMQRWHNQTVGGF